MKTALIIAIMTVCFGIYSDSLEMSNGDIISGNITAMDLETVTIQTVYGEVVVDRKYVNGLYLSSQARAEREGLLLEYLFDNNTNDTSPNNINATNKNLSFVYGHDGQSNSAISSSGNNTFAVVEHTEDFRNLSAFTIEFMIKAVQVNKTQYIFSKWTNTIGDKALGSFALSYSRGAFVLYLTEKTEPNGDGGPEVGGRYASAVLRNAITPGEWAHVAVTYSGGIVRFYINGLMKSEQNTGFTALGCDSSPLYILTAAKGDNMTDYNFIGTLDNFRLYNRSLDESEIQLLTADAPP